MKTLKMKFVDKKENKNCELVNLKNSNIKHSIPEVNKIVIKSLEQENELRIESVTSLKDYFSPKEFEQSIGVKLKKEPTNGSNLDFVFENEFIKREKVPKLEFLDMDIVESKPMLDISQQPKDTLVVQDTNKNQAGFHENKVIFHPYLSVTKIKRKECSLCGNFFDNFDTKKFHNQNQDLGNYICKSCEKCFQNELRLKRLKSGMHGTFKKDENKNGNKKVNLNKVGNSDDVEVKIIKKLDHECDVCKKGFIDNNNLNRHKRFDHDFDIEKSIKIVASKGDKADNQKSEFIIKQPHRCKICGFTCGGIRDLVSHMKVHEKSPAKSYIKSTNLETLTCRNCQMPVPRKTCSQHKCNESKTMKIQVRNECKLETQEVTKNDLEKDSKVSNAKMIQCGKCDQSFGSIADKSRHIKEQHYSYKCKE